MPLTVDTLFEDLPAFEYGAGLSSVSAVSTHRHY